MIISTGSCHLFVCVCVSSCNKTFWEQEVSLRLFLSYKIAQLSQGWRKNDLDKRENSPSCHQPQIYEQINDNQMSKGRLFQANVAQSTQFPHYEEIASLPSEHGYLKNYQPYQKLDLVSNKSAKQIRVVFHSFSFYACRFQQNRGDWTKDIASQFHCCSLQFNSNTKQI